MERTRRSVSEDQVFGLVEKVQGSVVEGMRRVVETVDAWLPEATTSRFAERLPEFTGLIDRGVRFAEQRLDHDYKLAKRVIKNQRGFLKDVVHAMAPPHGTTHTARKAPVKSAA